MSEYYNVKQAAEKLGVHDHTIRSWIKAGAIQAFQLVPGGKYSIYKEPVDAIANGGNHVA